MANPAGLTRRRLLAGSAALAALGASRAHASHTGGDLLPLEDLPDATVSVARTGDRRLLHALNRWTFGATPALLDEVRTAGPEAWLDQQLTAGAVPDPAAEARLASFDALHLPAPVLAATHRMRAHRAVMQLQTAAVVRAVHSRHQVFERMVELWTDHFNIDIGAPHQWALKVVDDREVVRRHALGRFEDLLLASAKSPAMLSFLDNATSRKAHPNENYARELLELHTVGVDGGYDETAVAAVARLLTGWTFNAWTKNGAEKYLYRFDANQHDPSPVAITIGGRTWRSRATTDRTDGESFLRWLAHHPGTARHVARTLIARFVSDEPQPRLEAAAAQVYLDHGTALAPTLRRVLTSEAFWSAPARTVRRPFDHLVWSLRVLAAEIDTGAQVGQAMMADRAAHGVRHLLARAGHEPFRWPTPDGYPAHAGAWLDTASLQARWANALDLTRGLQGIRIAWGALEPVPASATVGAFVDHWYRRLALRAPTAEERRALLHLVGLHPDTAVTDRWRAEWRPRVAGLVLAAPRNQVR